VKILSGTDSSPLVPGTAMGASVHHELSLYIINCGFTPIEALRSATSQAAKRFKLNDRGRLAVGLRADLLLVDGDPTTDIQCLLNVVNVWKEGKPLISALPEI
jgi:imidazolonepropionase-like amidohydrolase